MKAFKSFHEAMAEVVVEAQASSLPLVRRTPAPMVRSVTSAPAINRKAVDKTARMVTTRANWIHRAPPSLPAPLPHRPADPEVQVLRNELARLGAVTGVLRRRLKEERKSRVRASAALVAAATMWGQCDARCSRLSALVETV